jgi:peptidyl-dipeptidase A
MVASSLRLARGRLATVLSLSASLSVPTALLGCGGAQEPAASMPAPVPAVSPSLPSLVGAGAPAAATTAPTVDDARAFLAQVDKDLHELWARRDRAAWVSLTYITDDTEALAAAGEQATAEYITKKVPESKRFDGLALPPDLARQMKLLRLAQTVPAPSDPAKARELASVEAAMTGAYGKGEYCPPATSKLLPYLKKGEKCLHLEELEAVLQKSHDVQALTEAWNGWHATARSQRERFEKYVALGNDGAKELGFDDLGALWRAGYDMLPADFEADVERLWNEVKPLYDELHCYVRAKLREKYGKDVVPEHGLIPAELLGNMWAQDWGSLQDLVVPYKGEPSLDVSKELVAKKIDAKGMVKIGESFFTSLGFDPLPASFWERSMFTRPRDREVVCHASAWDVTWGDDLRIKMCIEPTMDDLLVIHHELGHDFYFSQYYKMPILFQTTGANDGFHEAIGDTIALSVTPQYLKDRGLLATLAPSDKRDRSRTNSLMKRALEKVSFLPFGLLIDKWRWDVFSGKTPENQLDASWWALKAKYQGVAPPEARTEGDFDPAAKFHVASSTPYIRYFLAFVYEFQFHRALCKAAGWTGPLDQCSIYGNKAAGEKLRAMLALGESKPWQDAMEVVTGERKADASAILEYFEPLRAWLKDQIKDEKCGW